MDIISVVVGLAILILGRQLFWLFVGGVGFLIGLQFAPQVVAGQPDWVIILVALGLGLLGALLAIIVQRFAVGLAGFLGGGAVAVSLFETVGAPTGGFALLPFLVGGIIGAMLVAALFDWAIIILSSFVGANLVVQGLPIDPPLALGLFALLLVVGIVAQARLLRTGTLRGRSSARR